MGEPNSEIPSPQTNSGTETKRNSRFGAIIGLAAAGAAILLGKPRPAEAQSLFPDTTSKPVDSPDQTKPVESPYQVPNTKSNEPKPKNVLFNEAPKTPFESRPVPDVVTTETLKSKQNEITKAAGVANNFLGEEKIKVYFRDAVKTTSVRAEVHYETGKPIADPSLEIRFSYEDNQPFD